MPHKLPAHSQTTSRAPAPAPAQWRELPPQEGFARVLTRWQTSRVHTDQTLARTSETVQRFIARLDAQGVTGLGQVTQRHVAAFVAAATTDGAAPELATQHARRTSVRTFYRTLRELGIQAGDPTMDLRLPPRGGPGGQTADRRRGRPGPGQLPGRARCPQPDAGGGLGPGRATTDHQQMTSDIVGPEERISPSLWGRPFIETRLRRSPLRQRTPRHPFGDGPSSRQVQTIERVTQPLLLAVPSGTALHRGTATVAIPMVMAVHSPSLRGRPFIEARHWRCSRSSRPGLAAPSGAALHRGDNNAIDEGIRLATLAVPSGTALHRGTPPVYQYGGPSTRLPSGTALHQRAQALATANLVYSI